jgi:hypothetical protein
MQKSGSQDNQKLVCDLTARYFSGGSKNTLTSREIALVLLLVEHKLMRLEDKQVDIRGSRRWISTESKGYLNEGVYLKIIKEVQKIIRVDTIHSKRPDPQSVRETLLAELQNFSLALS